MESKGKAREYILLMLKAIKSWLTFNCVESRRKVKVRNANDATTLSDNQPITVPPLRRLYSAPLTKVKCFVALLTASGACSEVIRNHDGSDGLKLGDIPELEIESQGEFARDPRVPLAPVPVPQFVERGMSHQMNSSNHKVQCVSQLDRDTNQGNLTN
jgi:hypothetical protein